MGGIIGRGNFLTLLGITMIFANQTCITW